MSAPLHKRIHRIFIRWSTLLFTLLLMIGAPASIQAKTRIAVVISESIRPYVEAVEGFIGSVEGEVTEYTLKGPQDTRLPAELLDSEWDLVLAIGPYATRLLDRLPDRVPKLYAMVLYPERVVPPGMTLSGVSLNIPPDFQITAIKDALPNIQSLGVLYDPEHSAELVEMLDRSAKDHNVLLKPIRVTSNKEIKDSLGLHLPDLDVLLFIPDPTVISESIVTFAIKEALKHGVPAVGYNRFFLRAGALIALIIDYRKIGEQAGELALQILREGRASSAPPPITVEINRNLAKKFGFVLGNSEPYGSGETP